VVAGIATVMFVSATAALRLGSTSQRRIDSELVAKLAIGLAVAVSAKLLLEGQVLIDARSGYTGADERRRTALLLTGALRKLTQIRFAFGAVCGMGIPVVIAVAQFRGPVLAAGCFVALVGSVAGELIERSQFFRAVSAPRMPGTLS
jgi:formate dehydrogenase iron-sulfur subunit